MSCCFHPPIPEAALATLASLGAGSWGASAISYRHHSAAPGLGPGGTRPAEPLKTEAARLASNAGAAFWDTPEPLTRPKSGVPLAVVELRSSEARERRGTHNCGVGPRPAAADKAVLVASGSQAVRLQVSERSGSQTPHFAPRTEG